MILTFSRNTKHPAVAAPRRAAAAVLTLLFAFCVLVASAPHRHAGDTRVTHVSSFAASHCDAGSPALATTVRTADISCPLCDWLYAPTLPADAPLLPPIATPARPFALLPLALVGRLLAAAPSRSSSRAPPAAV